MSKEDIVYPALGLFALMTVSLPVGFALGFGEGWALLWFASFAASLLAMAVTWP